MYFTSHVEYALDVYSSANDEGLRICILCWILVGNAYPCVEFPGMQVYDNDT